MATLHYVAGYRHGLGFEVEDRRPVLIPPSTRRSGAGVSVHGHEGPKTSVSSRWKEWGKERWRKIHNSFIVNGLRNLEKQSAGIIETGATLPGDGTPVHISLPRIADLGGKKRGSLPSISAFPRSARPSREWSRNCNGDSRLEKSLRARRKASFVHIPPLVPCALPDRHETPLFNGQNRAPGSRLERHIMKPVGRTTTADQRSRPDAGCRLSPAR